MPMSGESSILIAIVAALFAVVVIVVLFRLLRGGRSRVEEGSEPVGGETAEPVGTAAGEAAPAESGDAGQDEEAVPGPAAEEQPAAGPEPAGEAEPAGETGPVVESGQAAESEPVAGPEPGAVPEAAARAGAGGEPGPGETVSPPTEPAPQAWQSSDYLAALQRRKDGLRAELAEVLARRDNEGRSLMEIELRAVTGRLVRGEQGFAEFSAWCATAADSLEAAAADRELPGQARAVALLRAADLEGAEQALLDLAKDSPLAATAGHYAGRLAEERADFDAALARYQQAIELEGENPVFLQAAAGLARELGRFDEARDWLERFFELPEDVGTSELRALARHDLGVVYARDGQYGEAVELYREALAVLDEEHPQRGLLLHSLAETREKMGQYEEAGKLYIQAVQFNAARLGKHHPAVGTTLYKLAGLYEELEEDTKAEPLYRQSLAISRGIFGSDHPEIGTIMNNLAEVYRLQERYDEAEPLYRESLAIAEKNLGPDHLNVAVTLNNLAELCSATGRDEEAAELQERAFVIFQQGSPVDGLMELERDEVDVEELKGQTVAG